MTIKEAKEEIKLSVKMYLEKTDGGCYRYPLRQQRPILLMGPPGIGKTAIMEQIAQECGIGLVSYTMTHHTRQSAIGLPRIVTKCCKGEQVSVTEYTMSEIIASVYDCMDRTGRQEGILFLDEINCVSETLTPVMLQLLQNKKFGTHSVPEGWILVAAGNPPEYNRSAREFDIVTLDRVRCMELEADLDSFLEYAMAKGIHGAVLSYLRAVPDRFYTAKSNAAGRSFVTARGWEDLSWLLLGYEREGLEAGQAQIREYLGDKRSAEEFSAYYRLYRKYGQAYKVRQILEGSLSPQDLAAQASLAKGAAFEERATLIGLFLGGILPDFSRFALEESVTKTLSQAKGPLGTFLEGGKSLDSFLESREAALEVKRKNELISLQEEEQEREALTVLKSVREACKSAALSRPGRNQASKALPLQILEETLAARSAAAQKEAQDLLARLDRLLAFCAPAFEDGQENLLLLSGLARNQDVMHFLSAHPSESFLRLSEAFL